ncbi:MAG TPA: PTS sugar transporter subunit IIA [Chitinispirillaceae bacterium]|nr:PTS sugar transporter subunit IIA [Chitinispirillaceae bacterium]
MKIQDLLQKSSILIDLKSTEKDQVLRQTAKFMASLYGLDNGEQISRLILERESDMSTGIGYGIAIPHARITGIDRLYMVAARSVNGIEFGAIDDQPVHVIFMLVSPANTSTEHTQILSSLSSIMAYEDVREKLFSAETVEQFLDIIEKSEEKYIE